MSTTGKTFRLYDRLKKEIKNKNRKPYNSEEELDRIDYIYKTASKKELVNLSMIIGLLIYHHGDYGYTEHNDSMSYRIRDLPSDLLQMIFCVVNMSLS